MEKAQEGLGAGKGIGPGEGLGAGEGIGGGDELGAGGGICAREGWEVLAPATAIVLCIQLCT